MSTRRRDPDLAQLHQLQTLVLDALFLIDHGYPDAFQTLVDYAQRLRQPLKAGVRRQRPRRTAEPFLDWTELPLDMRRSFALLWRRMKGDE